MAASISLKHGKIGASFFKATAGYVVEGAKDYIREAMPSTSSIYTDAKREASEISSKLKTTTNKINQQVRRLKVQGGMRSIMNWYMNKGDEFGGVDSSDNLTFDIDGTDSNISDVQIGEAEKNANKISAAVVESNRHLLEGQMNLSADIHSAIDNQTAVISAGFEKVNSTLGELLEVFTKNTATLIETTAALKEKEDPAKSIFGDKFNISSYKNLVKQNMQSNPTIGMLMAYLPMLTSSKITPDKLVSMGMGMLMDKAAPNLKDSLSKLDSVVNNAILDSIIRLGEDKSGKLAKFFGYNASREEKSGERSTLSLKAVPFDSIAHEAITSAIPGYLRKILAHIGGGDYVYDYRSRSFRSQGSIAKDFHRASANRGSLMNASSGLRNSIGGDAYGSAIYDIMMADLGGDLNRADTIKSFSEAGGFEKYITELLAANGYKVKPADIARLKAMSNNISAGNHGNEIRRNAVKHTVNRNSSMDAYISEADAYGVDLTGLETSIATDIKSIMEDSGLISNASKKSSESKGGIDYTNYALYRIHQILRNGINVYQTGAANSKKKPYSYGNIERPQGAKMVAEPNGDNEAANPAYEYTNELAENAKNGLLDMAQKGLSSINSSMGNIGGYLKHKLFGEGYEYTNEKGETVKVATNDNGGIFGFLGNQLHDMFGGVKEKAGSWLKTVGGYFDYGNDGDSSSKRKQIMASAVGAFAGAGILGGPLGLLIGGLAGSAMGASSVGSKINEFLFGKGGKDADGNKKKTGIFTKLTNSIIDPIRFQFEKTFSHIGNVLKKNILGPLSDIGYVIKERIVNSTKSAFGKIFKVITAPFKAVGNALLGIAKAPISLLGGAARAGASAYTGVAGAGLNGIADILAIGGKDENGNRLLSSVHDRRKARNEAIKADSKKYNWAEWKSAEDAKREARRTALQEAMKEETEIIEDKVSNLEYHATHTDGNHSIFTHDDGIHKRLDLIIEALTGKKPTKGTNGGIKVETSGNSNGMSSSNNAAQAVGVAATLATEGNLTREDESTFNDLQNEADKEKPSKSKIRSLLNKMFRSQEKDKAETEEKKSSFWDFIKSTLGGIGSTILSNLPGIAGIAGLITLLTGKFPEVLEGVKNVFGFLGSFFKDVDLGESLSKMVTNVGRSIKTILLGDPDSNTTGANSFLSLFGAKVKNAFDLANPAGNIYHAETDASGADIKDQGKSAAKQNYQLTSPLKQSLVSRDSTYLKGAGKKAVKNYAKIGLIGLAGSGVSSGVASFAKKAGFSDEQSAWAGNVAGTVTTAGLYVNEAKAALTKKSSIMDNILNAISKIFNKIVEILSKNAKFAKYATKIKDAFSKAYNSTIKKFTETIAEEVGNKIAKACGKNTIAEVSTVLTGGLTIAAFGLVGVLSGFCGTEYLFGVLPGDADATMTSISSILKGALEAAEALPGAGLVFCAIDILDEFIFKSIFSDSFGRGLTLKSWIADMLYNFLTGDFGEATLETKRQRMEEEMAYYNSTYGANVDYDAFNDLVNNAGIMDTIWRGKMKMGENGHLTGFDKDGGRSNTLAGKAKDAYNGLSDQQKGFLKTGVKALASQTAVGRAVTTAVNLYEGAKWIGSKISGKGIGGPIGGKVTADEYYRSQNTIAAAENYKTGMPSSVFNKVYNSGYDFKGNPLGVLSIITSPYGYRKVGSHMESHNGVDMIPADGSAVAKVASPISGTVSFVRRNIPNSVTGLDVKDPEQQTGNMVRITGKDGTVREFMHLKSGTIPPYIKEGATVKNGSILGTMGATGRADGAHLHYTVKENGMPVDPMSYLLKQKYKTTSDTAGETLDYGQYDDSSYDGSESSEDNRGILAKLMDFLSSVGSKFLSAITGGLTGSTSDSSFSDSNTSNVHNADEFLKMVANEIGTKEEPMGSNNVKYNTWYYGKEVSGDQYMWCMVFVQWCFDHAGLTLPYKTALCKGLWDYYQTNMPAKCHTKNPKPGDIVILGRGTNGGHTGIVEKVNGVDYTTIEGNSGDQVKRINRKVSDGNLIGFITAVDFGSLSTTLSGNYGDGAEGLWKYFKQLGYTDNAIAGILGCWTEESSCKTARMEGDYLQAFKDAGGYDALVNDRSAMDAYTNKLFSMYAAKGISINRGGYKANDGHYYPGIGVAQWTGERARKLLEFAKSKGLDWKSPEAQLAFFDQEIQNGYAGVKPKLQAASTPEEATQIFESGYEGSTYGLSKRQQNAKALSMKYGSGGSGTGRSHSGNGGRIGGPLSGKMVEKLPNGKTITEYQGPGIGGPSSIGTTNYMSRSKSSASASSNRYARSAPGVYSSSASRTAPSTSVNIPSSGKGGVNDDVVILMARAIEELVKITNNTASSSDLLDSLNNKDFVDKGLRDSFEALNKVSKSKKSKNTLPKVSATAALQMANP